MRSSSRQPVSIHDCDSSLQFTFLTVIWHSYKAREMCHVSSRFERKYSFREGELTPQLKLKSRVFFCPKNI